MAKQYMDISKSDKEIINMTGKLLAGKGYHKADIAILLIDTIDNTEGKLNTPNK
ncbi:hypothetical protein [Alkalicoccobacillus plakortidis]|uniref:Uncharacterized protein n=1 Tax=Alkalicoccobacillus plakortidis TaxID=444060 RepID=A0ABT0XFT9_9BACI|nr:hypothetical protein [Alkalicoccobacillus plakortidis]MCM2674067.1 hypothetical protein [Alkalicoccobacillus plakortidis]